MIRPYLARSSKASLGSTTFASSHPAYTICNFPSFSRETASETESAMKIGATLT